MSQLNLRQILGPSRPGWKDHAKLKWFSQKAKTWRGGVHENRQPLLKIRTRRFPRRGTAALARLRLFLPDSYCPNLGFAGSIICLALLSLLCRMAFFVIMVDLYASMHVSSCNRYRSGLSPYLDLEIPKLVFRLWL